MQQSENDFITKLLREHQRQSFHIVESLTPILARSLRNLRKPSEAVIVEEIADKVQLQQEIVK